jgi:SNF2 family DNA or RNA helicase
MGHFDMLLAPEQVEALQVLSKPSDHILAFGTGLGKTYAALVSFEALRRKNPDKKFHLLVVCTKSATVTWLKEIEGETHYKYFLCRPEWSMTEYAPLTPGEEDITIVTYHQLEDAKLYLEKLYLRGQSVVLVLDEMHKIKKGQFYRENDKKKGITWYGLCKVLKQHSLVCWGLTATPLLNHIEDLYVLVNFMFPGVLGTKTQFMMQFTIRKMRKLGLRTIFDIVGYRNLEILRELIKPYVMSRFRDFDVRFSYEPVVLSRQENLIYLRAAMGILGGTYKDFAARLPDLQIAVDTCLRGSDFSIPTQSSCLYTSKEAKCLELIEKKLAEGKAVIVYSSLRESLDRLKYLIGGRFCGVDLHVVTGSTTLAKREQIVNEFAPRSIILMTGAGGESLNLQVSNTVIFFNLTFSIGEFIQVVGRVVRMNTEHEFMEVYIIVAEGTIDSYKRLMLEHNADKITKVVSKNPNLPEIGAEVSKGYIVKMRKDLLWRKKEIGKMSAEDRAFILQQPDGIRAV